MKLKLILSILLLGCVALIAFMCYNTKHLKDTNAKLIANQETLLYERDFAMSESCKYKALDSLNAAKITALELSLETYKRYKGSSLDLIKELGIKKDELEQIIDTQIETINVLNTELYDFAILPELDTVRRFEYKSKWLSVDGTINLNNNAVNLNVINKESLTLVESVRYKRFLGFLWRTKQIESRSLDVLSHNPHTEITNVEVVNIMR